MRTRTSITLSRETLRAIDRIADARFDRNRSSAIEAAIDAFVEKSVREARDERDRELLDLHADALNAEIDEVLQFQTEAQ